LIGAVINFFPKLFKAAVADVPFVDALTTMRDATIPLTVTEWEEWGNPNQEDFYQYMSKYSPYDNVKAQEYPALLVTAGLNDPRVAYWEPAKWVAKLRAMKTDQNPLLLKTDMSAGHFSASDRYKYVRETAFEYSFILDQLRAKDKL
jgi:oligopeptidase B